MNRQPKLAGAAPKRLYKLQCRLNVREWLDRIFHEWDRGTGRTHKGFQGAPKSNRRQKHEQKNPYSCVGAASNAKCQLKDVANSCDERHSQECTEDDSDEHSADPELGLTPGIFFRD